MKPLRVTFFGDSICVGQGVSLYKGWVTRVAKLLDRYARTSKREILITNSSVNGRTTRQALEDMPYHIQKQGVDVLIVQFGFNDCNYWESDKGLPRVTLGAFRENLLEILSRGQMAGARAIFLNSNHPTTRSESALPHTTLTYEDSNHIYNNEIKTLAAQLTNIIYFQNIYDHFLDMCRSADREMGDYLLLDGLHLSEAGHEEYYKFLAPRILRVVKAIHGAQ